MTSQEDNITADSIDSIHYPNIVAQDKESPEYLEKLNQYYSIKHNYEVKKQEKINKIIKNSELSLKQKQEAYSKVKMNCVNCGRRVGTIFGNNDGVLSAICGDKTNPCTLNISINTGKFVQLQELMGAFQDGIDDSKTDIIMTKLDLLFGYENETMVLSTFKKIKKELLDDLESLMIYRTKFIEVIENLDNKPEIQFTGFYSVLKMDQIKTKDELVGIAKDNGYFVKKSKTLGTNVSILVCGHNAGPIKMIKASEKGSILLNEQQFLHMVENGGELLESHE